jgi:hypothetical protein
MRGRWPAIPEPSLFSARFQFGQIGAGNVCRFCEGILGEAAILTENADGILTIQKTIQHFRGKLSSLRRFYMQLLSFGVNVLVLAVIKRNSDRLITGIK